MKPYPLVSESHSFIAAFFFPLFNLFSKEIEVQRTGGLIKVDILTLRLIAFHKQLVICFKAVGRFIS